MSAESHPLKTVAAQRIARVRDSGIELSHRIHAHPELGYEEVKASQWLAEALTEHAFTVTAGICDLPTAFRAQRGSGSLNVALLAEYDALPGIGHACGHNMIAAAAFTSAVALADVADELDLTVTVLGTPAEEKLACGGKILMLERGAFRGVHAALMVHPTPFEAVAPAMISATALDVEVTGRPAHASAAPQQARNAADALTIAQVGIGLLRQHLDSDVRISGIVKEAGEAPNIIPARARAEYILRARTGTDLAAVRSRVTACFEAGAHATGCELHLSGGDRPYAEIRPDPDLADIYGENALALGREFDTDERLQGFLPSSDAGNVSHLVPTIHPYVGLGTWPVVNHQPEFAQACATPVADDAVVAGGTALAWTAIDVATRPALRQRLMTTGVNGQPAASASETREAAS